MLLTQISKNSHKLESSETKRKKTVKVAITILLKNI